MAYMHSLLAAVNLVMYKFIVATQATESVPLVVGYTCMVAAAMGVLEKGMDFICQGLRQNLVYSRMRWWYDRD